MDSLIVDADTHVLEPPNLFDGRLPSKLRDRAPRVGNHKSGGKAWHFDTGGTALISPLGDMAGMSHIQLQLYGNGYEGLRPSGWDPAERIEDMNIDMVYAHVLFPGCFLYGPTAFSADRDIQVACVRAYNDWLSEFCSYAPHRLIGAALVPATGVDDAVAEMQRCHSLPGLRGALLMQWPSGSIYYPNHEADDRFWSVLEDLGMPVLVHSGFDVAPEISPEEGATKADLLAGLTLAVVNQEQQPKSMIPVLSRFILDGILDRHPLLKFVAVEVGAGWVPFFLEQTDEVYLRARFWSGCKLSMMPSEFWFRQCSTTMMQDTYALANINRMGAHTLQWSSDFPHQRTDWPFSVRSINNQFKGLDISENDRRLVVGGNALRVYGVPDASQEAKRVAKTDETEPIHVTAS